MVATFAAALLGNGRQAASPSHVESGDWQPSQVAMGTSTDEVEKVFCKPGYKPPLCLAKEFDNSQNLTYAGNGVARPAVAKDTLPGYDGIHKAANLNDGLYGPGASWISNSAYSWIKLDLGKPTTINTVTFGKDRLGNLNDGDPGQFVIAVAISDNVYADGNSSNDYVEYAQVYDLKQMGFNGVISGAETIKASFKPVRARFIKITFANRGTAVDEIEVFMAQPLDVVNRPTRPSKDNESPAELGTCICQPARINTAPSVHQHPAATYAYPAHEYACPATDEYAGAAYTCPAHEYAAASTAGYTDFTASDGCTVYT